MARATKQAQIEELMARVAELEGRNAALEARLGLAREVYKNQKARIGGLEAALNTRGVKPVVTGQPKAQPVVTQFTRRDGVVCERVRTGNRAIVRVVPRAAIECTEVPFSAFESALQ